MVQPTLLILYVVYCNISVANPAEVIKTQRLFSSRSMTPVMRKTILSILYTAVKETVSPTLIRIVTRRTASVLHPIPKGVVLGMIFMLCT